MSRTAPRESDAVDLDDLELMLVQVHRTGHRRPVHHDEFDSLALRHGQGRNILVPGDTIDRPHVPSHFAGQVEVMDAIRLARGERLSRAEASLEIERQRRRWRVRLIRDAGDLPISGDQHDPRAVALALQHGEHRIRARASWERNAYIQTLRDRDREAARADGRDRETVDRDQLTVEVAEIDVKSAHRGTVDDAHEYASARLDLDELGVCERAVVGEEGVIFDVIEVGRWLACRHRRRHLHRLRHARHRSALLQVAKICPEGVKLKSASMTTTSCWSAWSR